MQDYDKLTSRGKLKRLNRLARRAMDAYGLGDGALSFHCFQTNGIYRIRSAGGENYLMRLASPGWRTRQDLVNEALWLEALEGEPSLRTPRLIPAPDGERVLSLDCRGIPRPWNISLFSEQPGRLLGHALTGENLFKMGRLTAGLHRHGGEWERPAEFTGPPFEHYLSRGEEEVLFSREVLVTLPRGTCEILFAARDLVEEEYGRLDRKDLRVIHGDLWHGNIRIHRGELYPIDFEDTILGFRLHDIAMALLDLREEVGEAYPVLREAYRRGYERVLPWPEGSVEILQAGRMLWRLNWLVRYRPDLFPGVLERDLPLLRAAGEK